MAEAFQHPVVARARLVILSFQSCSAHIVITAPPHKTTFYLLFFVLVKI